MGRRGAKVVLLSETWEAFAWVIDGLGESGVKKKDCFQIACPVGSAFGEQSGNELSWQSRQLFARSDSTRGAYVSASAAVNAYVGVDGVLFAFRDCTRGAFVDAGAACDAVIANYISHNR